MAKLFTLGLLCVLLFSSALSFEISPEQLRQVIIDRWGVPPENVTVEMILEWESKTQKREVVCDASNSDPADGEPSTPCNDGNYCTAQDFCTMVGGTPKCVGFNFGTGQPGDTASLSIERRNKPCVANGDNCQVGICTAAAGDSSSYAVCSYQSTTQCKAADACNLAQQCRPATSGGGCLTQQPTNNGNSCPRGDADDCHTNWHCSSGSCIHDTLTCGGGDDCNGPTTCNYADNKCDAGAFLTGSCPRGDADDCHTNWHCSSGSCIHDTLTCGGGDDCNGPTTCNYADNKCDAGAFLTGSCTRGDADDCHTNWHCSSGSCIHDTLTCGGGDDCNGPTTCNYADNKCDAGAFLTGSCTRGDADDCHTNWHCSSGSCIHDTLTCSGASQCKAAQVCNYADNKCDDGANLSGSCDDGDYCTVGDTCVGGSCVPTGTRTCPAETCKNAGVCTNGACQPGTNADTSFDCYNGQLRSLANRCEPSVQDGNLFYDPNRCNDQPCVKDENPTPIHAGEGFCSCWSGWSGNQCEGIDGTPSDNPNTGGVGQDPFVGTDLPPVVDAKKGDFNPTVKLTLGSDVTITVTVPSSQNKWNKPAGTFSYSLITGLKLEKPVQNPAGVTPSSKRMIESAVEDNVAIHNQFGTINTIVPSDMKRAAVQNPVCNYPNDADWSLTTAKSGSEWVDTYTNSMTYTQLAACGLTYQGQDENYAFFNGTIKIERDFFLGNDRFHFDRTYSVEQDYSIQFPRNLRAMTKVLVSNNTVEFWAAVTKINFDPVLQKWSITIGTAINKPYYKLNLISWPAMNTATPGPFGTGITRDWTKVSQTDGADCSDYAGGDCSQEFVFETHSCDPIDITAMQLGFQAVCRQNGTPDGPDADSAPLITNNQCAYPNLLEEKPVATIDLHTGSTCPYHKDFTVTNIKLQTYASNSFDVSKTLFGISEEMYLGVDFDEPPALLKNVEVVSVCAYPRSVSQGVISGECPAARTVDSSAVFTDGPTTPGGVVPGSHKIALHVIAGLLKAKAQVATDGTNDLDVQVDLRLTYKGTLNPSSKRGYETYSRSFTVTAPVSIKADKEEVEENIYVKSSASASTCGLLVLILVIAALF